MAVLNRFPTKIMFDYFDTAHCLPARGRQITKSMVTEIARFYSTLYNIIEHKIDDSVCIDAEY